MLEKRFIDCSILEVSAQAWKLTIQYSYYNLYTYSDVFVYKSEIECIHRLVLERCHDKIEITLANGNKKPIATGAG